MVVVSLGLTSCSQEPAIIQMKEAPVTPSVIPEEGIAEQTGMPIEKAIVPEKIFVHVCGAVNQPGVYEMLEGNRVFEAIELAGGFAEEAHQRAINLADKVIDGQQVFVPNHEEAATMPSQTATTQVESSLININTADVTRLQELSGIGEAKAQEILSYREKNGLFENIEEIQNVSGIGAKLYERIKENITVN